MLLYKVLCHAIGTYSITEFGKVTLRIKVRIITFNSLKSVVDEKKSRIA